MHELVDDALVHKRVSEEKRSIMDIYLVRHGEYVDLGSKTLEQDSLNPLSDVGIALLQKQAKTLAAWQIPVEQIVTSPFVRAKQTAKILADGIGVALDEHVALTRTFFNVAGLTQILQEYAHTKHLMLVGHESDLSTVAAAVIGGGRLELARGGMIRIALDTIAPPQGRLIWLLSPDVMGS
jgi:phosphohistidine phosphatase